MTNTAIAILMNVVCVTLVVGVYIGILYLAVKGCTHDTDEELEDRS